MKIIVVWLGVSILLAVIAYCQHSENNTSLLGSGRNTETENWSELADMEVVLQGGNILR